MADLGFLPAVKRLLDRTPDDGQRMLFSATLDNGIDVLVKRYLTDPVTHSVDSEQSPVHTMDHHVLHVTTDDRLAGARRPHVGAGAHHRVHPHQAPGQAADPPAQRPRRARRGDARQPEPERAHPQPGRLLRRPGPALVATDIAARGIHVDDVALVIHADPPIEHKAYLHRSGRTARAGDDGTVVTLVTEAQRPRRDASWPARPASIRPPRVRVPVTRCCRSWPPANAPCARRPR